MSKKYSKLAKKTLVKLGIILIIILALFVMGITFFVRLCTLNRIYKKLDKSMEADNFNIKTVITYGDEQYQTYTCYKNGISKFVSGDGEFTWMYKDYVFQVNEDEKTVQEVDPEKIESFEYVDKNLVSSLYIGYNFPWYKKMLFVANLRNRIKTVTINDVKYYAIIQDTDNYTKGVFINKYTNKVIRGEVYIKESQKYIVTDYEIGFGNTTTAEVQFIDTTGFTFYNKDGPITENPLLMK